MKKFCQVFALFLFFVLIAFVPFKTFAQTDMGVIGLLAPVQKTCYSTAEKLSVKIKNYSAIPHSFAATPVTVNLSVTGPNAINFPSVMVNTGTLQPGDSLVVVISNNYNMTAAGNYTFNASTTVSGDVNTNNDAMPASSMTVAALAVTTTNPAVRCGPGTMTLGATSTPGSTIQWLTAPLGGTVIGTGNTFTTPNLTSTTTYYAAAYIGGGSANIGIDVNDFPVCGFPTSSTGADRPLRFTITKPVILNSAYIIPQATTITVALRLHNSFTNIVTKTFNFTAGQLGSPQQISLGWQIVGAGNYQITNASGALWSIDILGCGYPFTSPGGNMIITSSAPGSTFISNTTSYNGFYKINITEGCASPATAVVAQVNDMTAITQQPVGVATCAGAPVQLVVAAQGVNLVYQWRKNGVNIANSNNDTLAISSSTESDAGNYDVVVTGICGAALTSAVAVVNVAPGNTWMGAVSSDWNTSANWCAGIPSAGSNVTVFAGTPFQPVINAGVVDVRTFTVNAGATVTLMPNTSMNIYGDFVNNGTFSAANASVFFKGSLNQTVGGMTVGNVVVNGSGISLSGSMTVNQALTLVGGNLVLGNNNLTINGSVTGSTVSHIVTNSTGVVISKNIATAPITVPVGPSPTSYNPVVISNGSGRDYSVRVQAGLNPTVANPSRAVNRTWIITPNIAPAAPATLTFQYDDTDMNTPGIPTNAMEIGVNNGASWIVVTPNFNPTGSPNARQVISNTSQFGPMAISNIGGISWITATSPQVDPTIASVSLLPNIVETSTLLRVMSTRSIKVRWNVTDMQGRVVMSFDRFLLQGKNDFMLQLGHLESGMFSLSGMTDKGNTTVIKFVKQ